MAEVKTVKMCNSGGNAWTHVPAAEVKLYEAKGWETEANHKLRLETEAKIKAKAEAKKKAEKKANAEAEEKAEAKTK